MDHLQRLLREFGKTPADIPSEWKPFFDAVQHEWQGLVANRPTLTEEALRESKAFLEQSQAIAQIGSWSVYFGDEIPSVIWSTESCRILGYTDPNFVPTPKAFFDRVHPDEAKKAQDMYESALTQGTPYSLDLRIIRLDGETRWVHTQAVVHRDETGRPLRMIGTLQDITDRRQLEESSVAERELLQQVLKAIPYRAFWKDRNCVYLGGNDLFAKDAGADNGEALVGKTDYDLAWKKEEADFYRKCDQEVMDKGVPLYDIEEPMLRADGSECILQTSKVPLRDRNGKVFGILGMYMDITDRKRLERTVRQSEKMSAVGQLAAGVAHEINNPLAVILGFAESLRRRHQNDPALAQPLESVYRETIRCRSLVQNLLTFSREQRPERTYSDLIPVVEAALSLVETQAKLKNIEVVRDFQSDLPPLLLKPTQIQQVIINLCTNALDAMAQKGTLSVRIANHSGRHPHAAAEKFVRIQVSDTGCGIPVGIRTKIFDPFFTTKEVGKGTGLGLSLCYEIASTHQGFIDVESEIGKGTTFSVYLPLSPAPITSDVQTSNAPSQPAR